MQAVLEDLRSGAVSSHEVPQPELRPGGILVRTAFSAISTGTERAHREQADKSLIGKALARPDVVRQVLDLARAEGIRAAYQRVQSRLNTLSTLGYSCAGVVTAVAPDVREFQPGDRVACGGLGYASHCEINFVPKNLAVRVPDSVPLDAAALTTIGAIALQGFRQSQAVLGETVAVIGAGLVGILTIQLAKAAGCRVVAIDVDLERAQSAKQLGADLAFCSADSQMLSRMCEFSRYGADAAIVTAATPSAEPTELAANIARDRGRIVVVGAVGLGVSRPPMYLKELSLTLSRSYGPGRYDPQYEHEGIDYPIGYVRWTEKRNMEAFLDLLASGALQLDPLLERRCPVQQAGAAYEELRSRGPYTVLLEYPSTEAAMEVPAARASPQVMRPRTAGELRVCCIGAGAFAQGVIFPTLRSTRGIALDSVATSSGVGSESARRSFGFSRAVSAADGLQDAETDAAFILSRQSSHAQYVITALRNHKPVFVEKPLAVNGDQLAEIRFARESEKENGRDPFVMVGFNRRFAPFTERLRDFFDGRREPMMLHVRVNAGFIPRDHWAQQRSEGGRVIGELCHFVDWTRFVAGVPIVSVTANALPDGNRYSRDNVAVSLSFRDGSIANILYLANGDKSVPKEHFEVFCEGSTACIRDFCVLELTRGGKTQRTKSRRDKGHKSELERTVDAMRNGHQSPIPFEELMEVSEVTIAVEQAIVKGQPIPLQLSPPAASSSAPELCTNDVSAR